MILGDVDAAFAKADRVVDASIWVHRHQPVPMECRGMIASYDKSAEHLTIHSSTQSPHMLRILLPSQINVPMDKIRVLADDVGGGFGLKNGVQRDEVTVIAASIDLGRPVKWIEDRLEHLASGGQAREEGADIEAAVTDDGVLLGIRMDAKLNVGAYPSDPFSGAIFVGSLSASFQGPTQIEGLAAKHTSVFTNKGTYVSYRGPWATGDFLRERLLDVIARELDIDPIDVRRRNYVKLGEPPLAMLTGQPFVGVTIHDQRRAGGADRRLGRLPPPSSRSARTGSVPRPRHGLVPRGRARSEDPGHGGPDRRDHGQRGHAHVGGRRRQGHHRHPPAAARPEPRDDAGPGRGRRARREVRGREGGVR